MKNQSINRNWYAGKLSATVAIFAFFAMLSGCVLNDSDVAIAPIGNCNDVPGGIEFGMTNAEGVCVALDGSCSVVEGSRGVGERDSRGICVALTGSCSGENGVNVGERDSRGICRALTGSCTGAGISEGERDRTGTCVVRTGSCTAAGISEGERDGTGTCVVRTGSCTAAGISEGERDGTGTCVVRTGSCTAAGISEGERDGTGTCVVRTGSCTAAGISEGERDGTGTCVVRTGSCTAAGISEGERDGTGTCVVRTGPCTDTGAGISEGERDGTGTCVVRTGSCTDTGISEGERDGTGTCVVLTGTCGTGVNAGLRDDTGECIPFSTVTGPTPDDSNPGIVGTFGEVVMNNPLIAALFQTKMSDAVRAVPQVGSITQSSETADRVGIADENSITYGMTGDITLAISNSGSGVTWSDISTEDAGIALSYAAADIGDFKSVKLRKEIAGTGNLYVEARTDIERTADTGNVIRAGGSPTTLSVGDTLTPLGFYTNDASTNLEDIETNTLEGREIWNLCSGTSCQNLVEFNGVMGILEEESCTTSCIAHGDLTASDVALISGTSSYVFRPNQAEIIADTDYLVGGNWLYVPDTGGNWEIGAFADGSQKLTNDIPLRANAIYDGKAIGLRLNRNVLSNFEGDLRLTANFGTSAGGMGEIDGSITGSDLPAVLMLNTARYDLTGNERGIFTFGQTSMEGGYTGNWGGQLYGNIVDPSLGASSESSVSGTFGAVKGTPGESDFDAFLGFFGGTEQ